MAKIEGGPIGMAVSNEWCIVRKACACSSAGSSDLKIRNPLTGHSPSPSIALLTPSYVAAKQISFEFERRINQLKREIRHYSDSDQMEGRAYLANGADPVHDYSSKTSLRLTSTMTSLVDVGALGTSKAQTSTTLSAEDEKSRYLLLNQCRRQLCASLGQEIIGLPLFQTCKSLHPLLPSMFASASNDSLGGEETGETDCPRAAGISYQVARSASTIKTKSPSPPPANAEGIEGGGLWTATSEMMSLDLTGLPAVNKTMDASAKGLLSWLQILNPTKPPSPTAVSSAAELLFFVLVGAIEKMDVWGPPLVCAVDQKDKGMQRGWDAPLIRVNQLSSTPVTDIDRDHIADVGATRTSQSSKSPPPALAMTSAVKGGGLRIMLLGELPQAQLPGLDGRRDSVVTSASLSTLFPSSTTVTRTCGSAAFALTTSTLVSAIVRTKQSANLACNQREDGASRLVWNREGIKGGVHNRRILLLAIPTFNALHGRILGISQGDETTAASTDRGYAPSFRCHPR
ncbi:hypothetical protein R3P38DRAFT_2768532 [Favolaschia claudopus]|uniref:Uncharacterized protein n=1 Tax=Favolaschia claudopus TaxID=2862362 RepID=A0AAW0CR49_9AGAR